MHRRAAFTLLVSSWLAGQFGCSGAGYLPRQMDLIPKLQTSDAGLTGQAKVEPTLPPAKAAQACLTTAETLARNGHDAQAIQQFELARQYDPSLPRVSRRLAVLYDRQGNVARAMQEYQLALAEAPRDADLLNDYGYFHYTRGAWIEAEKWLRQALDVEPRHATAMVNLAMTVGQEGKYAESFELFARAVGEAEAHHNMGFVYQTHGKFEEAKEAYRRALALRPDMSRSAQMLAKLEEAPAADARQESGPPQATASRDEVIARRRIDEKDKQAARARLERFIEDHQGQSVVSAKPPESDLAHFAAAAQGVSLSGPVKNHQFNGGAPSLGRPEARE